MVPLISRLFSLLSAQGKRWFWALAVLSMAAAAAEGFTLGLVAPLVNLSLEKEPGRTGRALHLAAETMAGTHPQRTLVFACLIVFFAFVLKNGFLWVLLYLQTRWVYDEKARIARDLFAHHLSRPFEEHLNSNSAAVSRDLTTALDALIANGYRALCTAATECLTLAAIAVLLLTVDPVAATVAGVSVVVPVLVFWRYTRHRSVAWSVETQAAQERMLRGIQHGLRPIKEVKTYGKEEFFTERFAADAAIQCDYSRRFDFVNQLPRIFTETVAVGGMVLLAAVVAWRETGDASSWLATLGVFVTASFRAMPTVSRLAGSLTALKFASAPLDAIAPGVIATRSQSASTRATIRIAPFESIRIEDVSFRYRGADRDAVAGVSLSLHQGDSVAIVGRSGAGKTTLLALLLGLVEPAKGSISMDGAFDISHAGGRHLPVVGYVPQDTYLLDESIRRNVAFGCEESEIDEVAICRAISAASLDGFVATLPDGLDTRLGEFGQRISGGQRQRLGLARALYRQPQLLVLDEATSSLDAATELDVCSTIEGLRGAVTIVAISHRTPLIRVCRKIWHLEEGRVLETGDFDSLIRSSNRLQELVNHSAHD